MDRNAPFAPFQSQGEASALLHVRFCKRPRQSTIATNNVTVSNSYCTVIRNRLDGITGYRPFGHFSNAGTEGFNNKIRWLIRQAYGFRDREYLKLKIYQLPEINQEKSL